MKANIHPQWYPDAVISCACGNSFTVGSTKPSIKVEICAKCHPFFTGQQKFIDTAGQVEKFQKKQAFAKTQTTVMAKKKAKKQGFVAEDKTQKTLKEMLMGA